MKAYQAITAGEKLKQRAIARTENNILELGLAPIEKNLYLRAFNSRSEAVSFESDILDKIQSAPAAGWQ